MVRTVDAAARERFALVAALLGVVSVLTAVSLAPTMSTQAIVLLAALAAATALIGINAPVRLPAATLRPPRRAVHVPLVLAGRTTDVGHHPVRPRAPGRV